MIERDDPQDRDLSALYRQAAEEQPSAGLDARILAAARATTAPPQVVSQSWLNRWKIPVALAAIVLLTTTLTLLVQDEDAGRLSVPDPVTTRAPIPAASSPQPVPGATLNLGGAAAESRSDTLRDQPAREKTRQEIQAAPPPPMAAPAARSMAAPAAKRAELDERSPEQWLADIRRLRREGRVEEAETSLAEFRKRYPKYLLPDDLKQP